MTTNESIRARLSQRHQELSERLANINDDRQHRSRAQSGNWTERASERENDEVLDRLAESTAEEIASLRHSLNRLDENLYGVCESCGNRIAEERLHSVPYATLCLKCAAVKRLV
jgi:RNA polymerase-binding transcription factor DksA